MRLAVFGTGVLGSAIAERFHATGHPVTVYNRTAEKTAPLRDRGLTVASCPEEAMDSAEVILLVLADLAAIRSVLLRTEVARKISSRSIIQLGTIGPDESVSLASEIQRLGGTYFEAPVLGSVTEAKQGSLLIMVGATPEQFAQWQSTLRVLGNELHHVGQVGAAAVMKLALNQLIAAETAAFGLSLGLIRRRDISTDVFMSLLRKSALYASTFDKKLPRLLARDYLRPNFSTRHLLKDVDLMLSTARQTGLDTGGLQGVRELIEKTLAQGFGERDYSAVYEAIDPTEDGSHKA